YVQGVSAGKVGAVAARLGPGSMSSSRVSSMCASLDAEVDEFRTRPLDWQRWCHPWLDATRVRRAV
ncbi:transposase, partial [Collinsella ihumii]|uniref:transposase n=1 Tax=Collinsella ihumii TaxID=1720204 RepID=UPI0025AB4886